MLNIKKLAAAIGAGALLAGSVLPVLALTEQGITATVTAQLVSVSVSPELVNYGTLDFGTSKNSGALSPAVTFAATNNGNVNETFSVRGANATFSGGSWTLVTASPIADQFRHSVTGTSPVIVEKFLTTSNSAWTGTVAPAGTQQFTSTFYMPPPLGSSGAGQVATTSITVVATSP